MNEQRMQFAIGVVTLIAGFALAAIVIWFGEFQYVWQSRKTYYVVFDNAPGVEKQVPVRRAGIRVGEVRNVEYSEEKSVVVVTIVIEGENELREGDEIAIKQASLLGDVFLDIETSVEQRGKLERPIIAPFSILEGRAPPDTGEAFAQASELVPDLRRTLGDMRATAQQWTGVGERTNRLVDRNEQAFNKIMDDARDTMERMNSALESVNNVLDAKTQENAKAAVQNIRDASDDLKPTLESARKSLEKLNESVNKLDEVVTNLQTATKPIADRSEPISKNLDAAAAALNLILEDTRIITQNIRTQDGTLQRLASNPQLYQNLDDAAVLLIQNLAQLEGIMKDLKVFSDKIARHPGELGVQGVLTKDSGLKDVPPSAIESNRPKLFRK